SAAPSVANPDPIFMGWGGSSESHDSSFGDCRISGCWATVGGTTYGVAPGWARPTWPPVPLGTVNSPRGTRRQSLVRRAGRSDARAAAPAAGEKPTIEPGPRARFDREAICNMAVGFVSQR